MHVYIIESNGYFKIGLANKPAERIRELQVGNPETLKLIHFVKYESRRTARAAELYMHKKFKPMRRRGEWFEVDRDHLIATLNGCDEEMQIGRLTAKRNRRKSSYVVKTKQDKCRQEFFQKTQKSTADMITIDKFNLLCLLTRGVGLPHGVKKFLDLGANPKKGWKKQVIGKVVGRRDFLANCDPSLAL